MQRKASARGVIFDGSRILCVKLANFQGKGPADFWCTPGGGIEDLEGLEDALYREMVEETGIAPIIGRLLYIQQRADSTNEHIEFFFHIENTSDYSSIDLSKSTHGELEIAEVTFINPNSEKVLPKFLTQTNIADDIASNAPVKFFNYLK